MVLQRWDPFRELLRTDSVTDRFWRGLGVGQEVQALATPLDVLQDNDKIIVRASVPGVAPEDIQVTIEDDVLTVKAESEGEHDRGEGRYLMRERRAGRFHRSLRLPDTVDADKAKSRYENGVLEITFPKLEAKRARRLEVKAGK